MFILYHVVYEVMPPGTSEGDVSYVSDGEKSVWLVS
jgi:hypothetical protein